jgi:hypothetical protein
MRCQLNIYRVNQVRIGKHQTINVLNVQRANTKPKLAAPLAKTVTLEGIVLILGLLIVWTVRRAHIKTMKDKLFVKIVGMDSIILTLGLTVLMIVWTVSRVNIKINADRSTAKIVTRVDTVGVRAHERVQ